MFVDLTLCLQAHATIPLLGTEICEVGLVAPCDGVDARGEAWIGDKGDIRRRGRTPPKLGGEPIAEEAISGHPLSFGERDERFASDTAIDAVRSRIGGEIASVAERLLEANMVIQRARLLSGRGRPFTTDAGGPHVPLTLVGCGDTGNSLPNGRRGLATLRDPTGGERAFHEVVRSLLELGRGFWVKLTECVERPGHVQIDAPQPAILAD